MKGHTALFRESDRTLIAGDAFPTEKQETLLSVVTQTEQISGPPQYLTTDWQAAEKSVHRIRDLQPSLALPSHGQPMRGEQPKEHLELLIRNFSEIAVPDQGKFLQ